MAIIDTKTLADRLAGSDSFIRTKNGEVKGLAVTTRDNPEAPEIIVVGKGPQIEARAELFLKSETTVPLYIKQGTNAWAYRSEYRATYFSRDPAVIEQYRRHRSLEDLAGILFLAEEDDLDAPVGAGCWSVDPQVRKAVEDAAVQRVITYLEQQTPQFKIQVRQKDNCGYDLLATRNDKALRIEVKGTAGTAAAFWLTRNERAGSVHPDWRLALVPNALADKPNEPEFFTALEMESAFELEPYKWRATLKTR
ncbi:DUF3883 domain-containing protein [Halomonas tibetensis]|uniref:DUF3883 domain-containing protein n=1 Tax=Halomonas tibetensis TaxID=2259590 RepID=A0ABV7B9Q8_9GAMM